MTLQTSNAPTRSPSPARSESVWALVDARGGGAAAPELQRPAPTSRLAGLTLVARHARMAARQRWDGVVVWVDDDEERARVEAALTDEPPPARLATEVAVGGDLPEAPERLYVPLEARAIYEPAELAEAAAKGGAPEPLMRIEAPADLRAAERKLVRMIRKSVDADGVVSYYLFRPISRLMTRGLIDTPVGPNHVSLMAMAFGVAAAICGSFGGHLMYAIAGGLFWLGAVVDCVDGELARLRLQGSKLGEWLDTLADDVSSYGLMAGLGVGLYRDGFDPWWLYVGVGSGVLGFLMQAKLYADLARWEMTIDTAQYPWFFGAPSEGAASRRGLLGKLSYGVGFVFRRDAFVTIVAALLAFGLVRAAMAGAVAALAVFTVIFVTHTLVTAIRGENAGRPGSYFGIKDLFTIVNLMGGVAGIYFALEGNLEWAGYAIFAGYLLGDALDGPVARLTNTSNKFGSEFDAAADHIAQAIAPAIIVYVAFTLGGFQWLGLGLMALFIATASIRQARFNVADFDYPLTYCGLPRTISGLVAISLPNSTLFFEYSVIPYEGVAGVLALVAILNLTPIPYMTHKGRSLQGYVKVLVLLFLAVPPLLVFLAPEFFYDFIFLITFGYALTAWIPLSKTERREYWTEYKRWSREVAQK